MKIRDGSVSLSMEEYSDRLGNRGNASMKHIAAAIYLSFAFLFIFLQSFDGYYTTSMTYFIIALFLLLAGVYFIRIVRDLLRK